MIHNRYLSDNLPVCEKPSRLGYDFVVGGYSPYEDEKICSVCIDLVITHNMGEYAKESRLSSSVMYVPPTVTPLEDGVSAVQAFVIGLGVASSAWLTLYFLLEWLVF